MTARAPEFDIVERLQLRFEGGLFSHLAVRLRDASGRTVWRVVQFEELAYLPVELRDDPDVLGKQWAAIRGLYTAGVDFIFAACGVFKPERVGVVQFYGAAAEHESEEEALAEARRRMLAVKAALANYPQSRTVRPDWRRAKALMERIERLPRVLAILGHPDPRLARKGLGRDGAIGDADEELLSQQGENLLRGLAKIESDFVFLVTAAHLARGKLADALVRMSRIASQYASRQRGTIGASFSIAIPLAAALADTHSGQRGRGESHATSSADGYTEAHSSGETRTWGHSVSHGEHYGRAHTESFAETNATGHTYTEGHGRGWGHTDSRADTSSWAHTTSHATGVAHTESHTTGVAHTTGESWATTTTHGTSSGTTVSSGWSSGSSQAHTTSSGTTVSSGWSEGTSTAHTQSQASSSAETTSSGWSAGVSQAHTASSGTTTSMGVSHSTGSSTSVSAGVSQGHTEGGSWSTTGSQSQTQSQSVTGGVDAGVGVSVAPAGIGLSANLGGSASGTVGTSTTTGTSATSGASWSDSSSASVEVGVSHSTGSSVSAGVAHSTGSATTTGTSMAVSGGTAHTTGQTTGTATTTSASSSVSAGVAHSTGSAATTGQSQSVSGGVAHSTGSFSSTSHTRGGFRSTTTSESWGTADTRSESWGTADTKGGAHTTGSADSRTGQRTWGEAWSTMHAVTRGTSDTESWGESVGESWSEGRAVSRSHTLARSHTDGRTRAESIALSGGRAYTAGLGGGIVPGFAVSRAWQTEDDVAIRLTEITRQLVSLLNTASLEGGFWTTALLAVDADASKAASTLVAQSFHGPNVPTPVISVEGGDALRPYLLAMRPSLTPDGDPFNALLWTRWGTLLTPGMLAAYTAPNLFEEGTAVTIQEKLPPLAFYPDLKGEVVLGHQCSPETGDLTATPLRLSRERHFHTAFCGDTGYGKSVAAERMVYETTLHWKMKTIVLDFGAGWRKLLNAPGLEGHVEIRQLSPGGVRPLRWNPLQIGRNIVPEVQWRAFCDLFGNIAKLGQARQIHELRAMLRRVYVDYGVLVDDPEVRASDDWGIVRDDAEAQACGYPAGTRLDDLPRDARQRLAVYRSRWVGLRRLYDAIEAELKIVPPRDIRRTMLEGILYRLDPLVHGEAAYQYAEGEDAIDINEIVPGDWGVAILEGGAFLDDFSKAFLLGWAAWHIYTDAVVQRIRSSATKPAHVQIVFEEANKILAGLDGGEETGGVSVAEQFASMWRDSRKYGIWLHVITQSPSEIPPGILSSCNNIFAAQIKNPRDRDVVIAAIHRSEKGFVDETWRRFLASIPVARAVVKLGYSFDRAELEPVYVRPLLLDVPEPTDEEIAERLGRITPGGA